MFVLVHSVLLFETNKEFNIPSKPCLYVYSWVWGVTVEPVRIALLETDREKLFISSKLTLLSRNNSKYDLYKQLPLLVFLLSYLKVKVFRLLSTVMAWAESIRASCYGIINCTEAKGHRAVHVLPSLY